MSWDRDNEPEPYEPSRLWRGVINALIIEGCVLLILIPLFFGLDWI